MAVAVLAKAVTPVAGVNRRNFASYASGIRSAIYGLWSGQIDLFNFVDSMIATLEHGLRRSWYEGAAQCSIQPAELTLNELDAMRFLINSQVNYVMGLANDIQAADKSKKGKLRPFIQRGQMWINLYNQASNQARQMACGDQKMKWVISPIVKVHCSTCLKLSDRVYRASIWKKYDIRPGDTRPGKLACNGFRGGCGFMVTSDPVTPGRPPNVP